MDHRALFAIDTHPWFLGWYPGFLKYSKLTPGPEIGE